MVRNIAINACPGHNLNRWYHQRPARRARLESERGECAAGESPAKPATALQLSASAKGAPRLQRSRRASGIQCCDRQVHSAGQIGGEAGHDQSGCGIEHD